MSRAVALSFLSGTIFVGLALARLMDVEPSASAGAPSQDTHFN